MQEDRNTNQINEELGNNFNKTLNSSEDIENEILDRVVLTDLFAEEDLSKSLKQQVNEELELQNEMNYQKDRKRRRKKIFLVTAGSVLSLVLIFAIWLVGTKSGRKMIYHMAGGLIYNQLDNTEEAQASSIIVPDISEDKEQQKDNTTTDNDDNAISQPRKEEYVTNYLIFGIEEIENASNTDSMMIASINTKDNSVKLTSLMRDTYINVPGDGPTKLNAVYSQGGADKLVKVIEQNYKIKIDGYAHINFEAFEKIVDRLGGINIELGEEEARYLNRTNYISNRANRNVKPGMNLLNGNQALGYVRVRKCVTLGGANDDYGRTLRQRRALSAIFNKYKSKGIIELLSIMNDCLGYVKTNISAGQIEASLEAIVENKITNMDTNRIPADGMFEYYRNYNGVDDPLVIDWNKNLTELYKFLYLDTDMKAKQELSDRGVN